MDELELFGDFDDEGDVDEAAEEGDAVRELVNARKVGRRIDRTSMLRCILV